MPRWKITATSRTGDKVNQITGAPTDSKTAYSKREVDDARRAAAADPRNLTITVTKEN